MPPDGRRAGAGIFPRAASWLMLPVVNLRLPRTVRSIDRVRQIAQVLSRHGFGHVVARLRLAQYVPLPRRWQEIGGGAEGATENLGRRLAAVCQELGPTFVKLGQMLSTRPDVVPADIVAELARLQDRVPPFDSAEARRIVAANIGAAIEEGFVSFEDVPLASGSIAQVHRAVLAGEVADAPGRPVVVKIKRPGIEDVVQLDMAILRWIAQLAERLVPELALYRPTAVIEEFERTLLREMDFINEAATMQRFAEAMSEDPWFRTPRVYWEATGPSVLTLEMLEGISGRIVLAERPPEIDRKALAARLAQGFLRQYLEIGLFHADPHPGNLLITPPAGVGLIDFGLTGQIDDQMLDQLVVALVAAFNHEPRVIVEVLADLNCLGDATDRHQLQRELGELIEKYYGLPLHRFDMQTLFYEITGLLRRNTVSLPREFVLLGKSLVAISGLCLQLDPDLDLVSIVRPRLRRLTARRLEPGRLMRSATITGWHLLNILKSAPGQMRDVFRRLATGQWHVQIRHQNLDDLAHEIDRASNRLSFSVIIGALVIGSSWIITNPGQLPLVGLPLSALGMLGFLIAGFMGLWLVVAILRSGKLS